MYNVHNDVRIWVNYRNGDVVIYENAEALGDRIYIDYEGRPYINGGYHQWRHGNSTIGHTWNDRSRIYDSNWDRLYASCDRLGWEGGKDLEELVDCLICDADGRILDHDFLRSICTKEKGVTNRTRWTYRGPDKKKVVELKHGDECSGRSWYSSKSRETVYRFREDPVPGVRKFARRYHYHKRMHTTPERRASFMERDDGVKWRCARNYHNLPSSWDDHGRYFERGWKTQSKKIRKQWMKNI